MAEFATMNSQGFPYGINWSKNPEAIADTELVQAENCEYDYADGGLRTVPGIKIKMEFESSIDTLFYDNRHKRFFFSTGINLYVTTNFESYAKIGQLNGVNKPVYTMFGELCLIASGGQLNSVNGENIMQSIANSPAICDYVTVRCGRVLTYATNSDQLNYSAIGDCTSWTNDAKDSSSAQFVNVGYKDPGNIMAMDFLSSLIMVYKEDGRAYKIVGEPQDSDFSVQAVSQTAYCGSERSTVSVDNKSYYIGSAGMMSFSPTNAYGDVAPFEEGININAWVIKNIDDNCEIWHVPPKKQIWVKTQNDNRIYIYHYMPRYPDGRGTFTVRTMAHSLHDVCSVGDSVYVAYGNKIGVLDIATDLDDDVQIQTSIVGANKLASQHSILVMNRLFISHNVLSGIGTIKCGKKTKTLVFSSDSPYAYDAVEYAYDSIDSAYTDDYTRSYKVGGGSNKSVQVKVLVQSGAISIRDMQYQYLEV